MNDDPYSLTSKPLTLATIEEIYAELDRRFDAVIVLTYETDEHGQNPYAAHHYMGGRMQCRGMVEEFLDELRLQSKDCRYSSDEDDDES